MKRANGTGTIYKIKRPLRKPYQIKISLPDGRRKVLGYAPTLKEAEKMLSEYISKPYDIEYRDISMREIWEKIAPNFDVSKSRFDCYQSAFGYLEKIADVPLRQIHVAELQEMVDACPHSSATKNNIKTVMHRIYEYALMNDIVSKDCSRFVKIRQDAPQKEKNCFTKEEIEKAWKRADEWQYAMLIILLYTGMRIGELLDLKKEDVYDGFIHVTHGKNRNAIREIPIHERIESILSAFMELDGEFIICKPNGTRIEYKNFMGREWKEMCAYLEAEHTPHEARHTFITRMHELGCDVVTLQSIVGHQPDNITHQVYTHISAQMKTDAIKMLKY